MKVAASAEAHKIAPDNLYGYVCSTMNAHFCAGRRAGFRTCYLWAFELGGFVSRYGSADCTGPGLAGSRRLREVDAKHASSIGRANQHLAHPAQVFD